MYEYKIDDLSLMLSGLISVARDLSTADDLGKTICDDRLVSNLAMTLDGLAKLSRGFQADPSLLHQICALQKELTENSIDRREAVLHARVKSIIESVQVNLQLRKFMYVPSDQAAYWFNVDIFGDDFIVGFPRGAMYEAVDAGNCFAAGLWTSSVFHSMRVAEYGLRALARRLKVRIAHKGKYCPLEYGDWDTVITAIRNKILEVRKLPRGAKKEVALQFLSNAADHCEYMKDIWRNEVSHTRRRYKKSESLSVINRVGEFVKPLAEYDAKKFIDKRVRAARKLQQVRQAYGTVAEGLTQRPSIQTGSGEDKEKG